MLRLWLRLKFRRLLIIYLKTGHAADRAAMLEAALRLNDCGEQACRVVLHLEDLAVLAREPEEPMRIKAMRA